jgi:hypothetical protein
MATLPHSLKVDCCSVLKRKIFIASLASNGLVRYNPIEDTYITIFAK